MSEFVRPRSSYDGAKDAKRLYPELPDPLEVGTYDNHTHLEIEDTNNPMTVADHLAKMTEVNMLGAVQVGVTLESSRYSAEIAKNEPMLLAAVAIHPNEAPTYSSMGELNAAIDEIAQLAAWPRVRAIGETGLDYFRTEGDKALEMQHHSFRRHIQIAKDHKIALQIHDRDAHDDVVATLLEVGAPEKTVFHCYSGDLELAAICKEHGWYLSFAGNITFKKNQHLRDSLLAVNPEQVLVETDAPFLTPEPLRGRPNAPYLVPHTLRFMADLLEVPVNDLAKQINDNTLSVYGSWSEGLA